MIVMYCGLFYISGELNYELEVIFFSIIIFANIYFLTTWLKYFLFQYFVEMSKKFSFLAKLQLEKKHVTIKTNTFDWIQNEEYVPGSRKEFMLHAMTGLNDYVPGV